MSDRIGEQILAESYKVLYDYIAINESEFAKLDLQIKTFQKIEDTIKEEAKSKSDIFEKLKGNREKLEEPIVILYDMSDLHDTYSRHKSKGLEIIKMISSNDADGIKDGGYERLNGVFLADSVNDIGVYGPNIYRLKVIDKFWLSHDDSTYFYRNFLLKAFPVWVKSAKRLLSAANKYSKD